MPFTLSSNSSAIPDAIQRGSVAEMGFAEGAASKATADVLRLVPNFGKGANRVVYKLAPCCSVRTLVGDRAADGRGWRCKRVRRWQHRPSPRHTYTPAAAMSANDIRNKIVRSKVKTEMRKEKASAKREKRDKRKRDVEELGKDAPPAQVPRTLESMREFDETVVAADDEEIAGEEAMDEYAEYFGGNGAQQSRLSRGTVGAGAHYLLLRAACCVLLRWLLGAQSRQS